MSENCLMRQPNCCARWATSATTKISTYFTHNNVKYCLTNSWQKLSWFFFFYSNYRVSCIYISAESKFRIVCNFLKEMLLHKKNNFTRGIFVILRFVVSKFWFLHMNYSSYCYSSRNFSSLFRRLPNIFIAYLIISVYFYLTKRFLYIFFCVL